MGRVRDFLLGPTLERTEVDTDTGIWPQVSAFWESLQGVGFSPRLIERVWVAERCIQVNSQQIARMPLRHVGSAEPVWVTNPDPVWFPNGVGDAVFAIVSSMYGWGDAFLLVTDRYASGFPSAWTVLNPEPMSVELVRGRRFYRSGQNVLNPDDVVQISRNPRGGLRGTSALRSYSSYLYGLLASAELGRVLMGEGGVPNAVLKSQKKLTKEQAEALQTQWVERTAVRRGAPAVLPPDIDFEQLAFSPNDLLLLDAQQFDARVIASAFGVPPFLINMPLEGGLTYQSPQMLLEGWWRIELSSVAAAISDALSANMLPRGSSVEFDAREALAPTFQELAATWLSLVDKGIATIDEARAAVLHLPAIEEGEALAELMQPPSSGASPTQQPSSVVALRPTQAVNT